MSFKTSPPAFVVAGLRELAAIGIMSRQLRDLYRDAADIIESLTKHATPPATIEQFSTVQTDRQAIRAEAFREAAGVARGRKSTWMKLAEKAREVAAPLDAAFYLHHAVAAAVVATAIEALATHETEPKPLTFGYVNYRGEASTRRVIVQGLRWGSTEWHPEPQWLLTAFDLDKQAVREFAVKDMRPIRALLETPE